MTLIAEGKINKNNLKLANLEKSNVEEILKEANFKRVKDVLILTIDGNGKIYIQGIKGKYQTLTYNYKKEVV